MNTIEQLISNLAAIITAIGVIVVAYLNYRSNQQRKEQAVQMEQLVYQVATVAARGAKDERV